MLFAIVLNTDDSAFFIASPMPEIKLPIHSKILSRPFVQESRPCSVGSRYENGRVYHTAARLHIKFHPVILGNVLGYVVLYVINDISFFHSKTFKLADSFFNGIYDGVCSRLVGIFSRA